MCPERFVTHVSGRSTLKFYGWRHHAVCRLPPCCAGGHPPEEREAIARSKAAAGPR
jgi:hypothetical protein